MKTVDMKTEEKFNHEIAQILNKNNPSLSNYFHKLIVDVESLQMDLKESRKELQKYKENELQAFAIGDALADGIYVINNQGVVIAINKAFTSITSVKEEEIIGKNAEVLVEKEIVSEIYCKDVLIKKQKLSATCMIMKTNRTVLITANPILNEEGELSQVITIIRDVTKLYKLQHELENSEKTREKYLTELEYLRKQEIDKIELIGESQNMRQIKELIAQVGEVDATVLITGETGVGKEVVAREIHKNSKRKNNSYIKLNCAAIPEHLLESELFGYEKGAFTGALNKEKLGLFEMANKGTILLDEIGEMPINLQSKLLRVLQEKELTRVGGTTPIKVDVRVIAATNNKLEEQINKGEFREDLFYRLNVIPISIPPLRARKEDISLLVNHFLEKYNEKYNKKQYVDSTAIELLKQYDWPGNVRELENIIERLSVITTDLFIEKEHVNNILNNKNLSKNSIDTETHLTLKDAVNQFEMQLIENVLKTHGSTHKAARVLGVSQPTVLRKAKLLGIEW